VASVSNMSDFLSLREAFAQLSQGTFVGTTGAVALGLMEPSEVAARHRSDRTGPATG